MDKDMSIARAKRIEWVGHNEPWLWPVLSVVGIAAGVVVARAGLWWVVAAVPVGLTLGYVYVTGKAHQDLRCARCWRAEPPASSALRAVRKHGWALLWAHITHELGFWLVGPVLVCLVVPWIQVVVVGVVMLIWVMSSTSWALLKHKQLARWCPQCPRDGGGGGSAPLPDPGPVLSGSK